MNEMRTNITGKQPCRKWTREEDKLLHSLVLEFNGSDWKNIALKFGGKRTYMQCFHRWNRVKKPGLQKGAWSPEEDEILRQMVISFGKERIKWGAISEKLKGRIGKQCRERWTNHLDPDIRKCDWDDEENYFLYNAHRIYGNRWKDVAAQVPRRTDNSCKNRWNSKSMKKWLCDHNLDDHSEPQCTPSTGTASLSLSDADSSGYWTEKSNDDRDMTMVAAENLVGLSQSSFGVKHGLWSVSPEEQTQQPPVSHRRYIADNDLSDERVVKRKRVSEVSICSDSADSSPYESNILSETSVMCPPALSMSWNVREDEDCEVMCDNLRPVSDPSTCLPWTSPTQPTDGRLSFLDLLRYFSYASYPGQDYLTFGVRPVPVGRISTGPSAAFASITDRCGVKGRGFSSSNISGNVVTPSPTSAACWSPQQTTSIHEMLTNPSVSATVYQTCSRLEVDRTE